MVRTAVLLVTTALSVLFAVGSVLAAVFELQGFGSPRDEGPRPLYLASLAVGFFLCVAAPFLVRKACDRLAGPDPASGGESG